MENMHTDDKLYKDMQWSINNINDTTHNVVIHLSGQDSTINASQSPEVYFTVWDEYELLNFPVFLQSQMSILMLHEIFTTTGVNFDICSIQVLHQGKKLLIQSYKTYCA